VVADDRYDEDEEGPAAAMRAAAIARHERRRETRRKLEEAEDERDRAVLRLLDAADAAADDLRMQDRELEMLETMLDGHPPEEPPPRRRGDAAWLTRGDPEEGIRILSLAPGDDNQLRVRRERVKADVFRPDARRLPTVSLEEAADKELADALQRQREQARETVKPPHLDTRRTKQLEADGDEDDELLYDFATKRDEAWDTWKEHHPPGSGNKGDHIY